MAGLKRAFLFDANTKEYLYDWVNVYPNDKEEYEQPENSTWAEPKKNDGSPFILPYFIAGIWQEGGTAPEPTPPTMTDAQRIAQLTIQLATKDAQIKSLQQQQANAAMQLASVSIINNEQQTKLAAIEKKIAALQ